MVRAKVFSFIVKDKGIVLHGDVKFCEKCVTGSTGKYILDLRDGIDFLRFIALLRAQRLDTQWIVSSFLGMMKVPLIQD